MDYFTKNKMMFWCVVVLVIINIITITSVWTQKRPLHGPHRGPQAGRDGQSIMEEQLELTDEQSEKIDQLRQEHFHRTRPLHDDIFKIKMDILHEMFASRPDAERIAAYQDELTELQGEFQINLFTHFQQLKDACTEQQQEELKYMLIELIESTSPRGPHGRNHPPMPGHGPRHRPPPR